MRNRSTKVCFDGKRLRTVRKKRKMSVQDLAIYSRISARHIWRLERGERPNPSVNTVARLAIALETTLEYLVGMTNDQVSLHQLSAALEERR